MAALTSSDSVMYVFGDIHLDPFYRTTKAVNDNATCEDANLPEFPMIGCDTSIALMESAIEDIFQQASLDGNGVMLITGDFLRHRMMEFDVPNAVGPAKHAVEYELARNITYLIGSTITKYQAKYFRGDSKMNVVVHPNYFSLVFGNEDCVPNYEFNSVKNSSAHPALPHLVSGLMLITGDFLRHRMMEFDVPNAVGPAKHAVEYELARNITYLIGSTITKYQAKYFRGDSKMNVVVHPNYFSLVFGNEDCVPNYEFNSVKNSSAHPALPHLVSGTSPPGTNLLILAINTVIYSKDHKGLQGDATDPCGQFVWLEEQLNTATINSQRVMILGHIIPEATKWNATFLDTYRHMMKSYTSVISAQFFGHTHMFTFLAESDHVAPPLFDVPGITPRDGNMPAYLKVQFTDQGAGGSLNTSQWIVKQITGRFIDVSDPPSSTALGWQTGMTFPNDFSTYPATTKGLMEYAQYLLPKSHHEQEWLTFQKFYYGGVVMKEMSNKKKTEVLCKATCHSETDYEACKEKYKRK
ncbi:Hypothetical protein, putative [Bodo saltans]|uniref:Calcineurin-like phosphoesterase domain-containing protein n=1 Tax=Bodo saltans TaxID=75058 RepID=A0A0S4IUW2_BODSA|nr:Hypothetical protein, putative [Bodo saltans]|eukprot:CUG01146.1 Hypothetical protein, putative [Bodo saltans]